MAKLTAKQRKKIPASKMGNPNVPKEKSGSFPLNDKNHIQAAKRFERFANPATKKRIDAAAKKAGVGSKKK